VGQTRVALPLHRVGNVREETNTPLTLVLHQKEEGEDYLSCVLLEAMCGEENRTEFEQWVKRWGDWT
jgi:hypothetical protein